MRVSVAKSAGFCFGVRRALRIARETAERGGKVSVLGDLVHNEDVLKDIGKLGIVRVRRLTREAHGTLLLCAHGTPRRTIDRAGRYGYRTVDATCPMVKEIHRIAARMVKEGRRVIVIGDQKHDEVRGIVGGLKTRAIVIDGVRGASAKALAGIRKAGVVVQSTQNREKVEKIVEKLRRHIPDLEFENTICRPTRVKQKEMMSMPLKNDVMIIIGSRTSANTKRLYEISKSLNKKTHWVRSRDEIRPSWFTGSKKVGVGAGASTPDSTTREVVAYIRSLGQKSEARGQTVRP